MIKKLELTIPPEQLNNNDYIIKKISSILKLPQDNISAVLIKKRSIDARQKHVVFRIVVDVYVNESPVSLTTTVYYKPVDEKNKVLIIGNGPAGTFAALKLIELGIKPVIIERGKDVRNRRRDIKNIYKHSFINPDSNYCFGEGGAGTFSDGKLYTRSTKRGDIQHILNLLVQHGASNNILFDAHPHIGSNKLPIIVQNLRKTITDNGGEILFNSKLTDLIIKENKLIGAIINNETEYLADALILATGHSARDIYFLLHQKNILIEPKPFALGVRIEHPQNLIDEIQYHTKNKSPKLPPASYALSCNIDQRGVYSFCMCPGGIIIPASTTNTEIVVNGMSVTKRNSPFANSGVVVEITKEDLNKNEKFYPFNAIELQKEIEYKAYLAGKFKQAPPAQRVTDFINNKISNSLPESSYIGELTSYNLNELFPDFITDRLKKALIIFNKKMKGYISDEALLVAPESRTSSPIKIPRDKETLMHIQIEGLFPCGEGAGYAGGIMSAAIDGEVVAKAVYNFLKSKKN